MSTDFLLIVKVKVDRKIKQHETQFYTKKTNLANKTSKYGQMTPVYYEFVAKQYHIHQKKSC